MANSPYAATMGFIETVSDDGTPVLTMDFDPGKAGRPGFIHGGAIAGLLEAAAYRTVERALAQGDKPLIKPISVTVSFMRGGREVPTHAQATIERLGRRIANVESVAWQDDRAAPIATAQINVLLAREEDTEA